VKVATWNVNGIRARESQFVGWVRRDRPDVVCLQEIKATPEQLGESLTMLPEYWNYWHGGPKGYSGVSLHLRKDAFPARPDFGHPGFDVENRVVQATLGSGVVVASVYVPNGGKDYSAKLRFLEAMRGYVDGLHAAGGRVILCGDLNVARTDMDVHAKERKPGAMGQRPDERDLFERVLACDLDDVARVLDPTNDALFTWWPPWRNMRQKNQGWRIDYVLVSARRGMKATECKVMADVGTSDHAPVVAVVET
jgi:exodeoxyribonuclease-3